MKHYKKEPRYVSILTVRISSASSVIDMLRYDRCCPLDEDEASKLVRLISDDQCGSSRATPADHVIRLMRFAKNVNPATTNRWRSFNCVVLDERSPEDAPLSDEEILNLAKVTR